MNLLALVPLPYRILALALLAAAVWGHGYIKGVSGESARQEAATARAQAAEWQRYPRALARGQAAVRAAQQAQAARESAQRNLRQEIHHAQNRDLAIPECPADAAPTPLPLGERGRGEGTSDPDRPAFRVTRYFVGLWDGAWTDPLGQPLFGHPTGTAAEGAQPSAVGPRELLENHRENAELCTDDRDRLDRLIDLVEQIEAEWDRAHPSR